MACDRPRRTRRVRASSRREQSTHHRVPHRHEHRGLRRQGVVVLILRQLVTRPRRDPGLAVGSRAFVARLGHRAAAARPWMHHGPVARRACKLEGARWLLPAPGRRPCPPAWRQPARRRPGTLLSPCDRPVASLATDGQPATMIWNAPNTRIHGLHDNHLQSQATETSAIATINRTPSSSAVRRSSHPPKSAVP
jgi:hypothetical protein